MNTDAKILNKILTTGSSKAKSLQFKSQSGHMPGLWVQSGCMREANNLCFSLSLMFLSLSFSLPSPLSKKIN